MCIITLAFQAVFTNMADDYKLKRYRFSNIIIIILALYDQAPSHCQVNLLAPELFLILAHPVYKM